MGIHNVLYHINFGLERGVFEHQDAFRYSISTEISLPDCFLGCSSIIKYDFYLDGAIGFLTYTPGAKQLKCHSVM